MDYLNKLNKYKLLYQKENKLNTLEGGSTNIDGRIVNLYFIRHGESMHNLNKQNKNIFDPPLTKEGISQSSDLYKNIIDIKPDLIYTSPLRRTIQTLFYSLLNQINNDMPIIIDENLREFNRGRKCDFRHSKDQIIKYTKLLNYNNINYDKIPDNLNNSRETEENLNKRIQQFLEDLKLYIKDKPNIKNIVIYSHGLYISNMLKFLASKLNKTGTCEIDTYISNGKVCAALYSVNLD